MDVFAQIKAAFILPREVSLWGASPRIQSCHERNAWDDTKHPRVERRGEMKLYNPGVVVPWQISISSLGYEPDIFWSLFFENPQPNYFKHIQTISSWLWISDYKQPNHKTIRYIVQNNSTTMWPMSQKMHRIIRSPQVSSKLKEWDPQAALSRAFMKDSSRQLLLISNLTQKLMVGLEDVDCGFLFWVTRWWLFRGCCCCCSTSVGYINQLENYLDNEQISWLQNLWAR